MAFANIHPVPFGPDQVAIAISHSALGSGHIGIGFHSAKAGPQVLHLAWHHLLQTHAIPAELKVCWAVDALCVPPSASRQLVALVRAVSSRGPTINYGINFVAARGSFSSNGGYKAPKGSDGLTCATFVVEVFRAGMVNLIDTTTWQPSAANLAWSGTVCSELSKVATPEHVVAVRKSINGLRIRPVEVAGAAQLGPKRWPADFTSVQQPARDAFIELAGICSPPAQTAQFG